MVRKISIRLLPLAALVSFALMGCSSSEQGSPDSWGTEDTNVLVEAEVTPETGQVDLCTPGEVGAVANITAGTVDEDLPENTLYLEGYTVSYEASTGGAPPMGSASYSVSRTLPVDSLPVVLIDEDRKRQHLEDITTGGYAPAGEFPSYVAEFEFHGEDSYGSGFVVRASVTFSIGKYTDCTPALSPSAISLVGLENPDSDASDDVTFRISGGVAPFTVYSDNEGVIESPGELSSGVDSFTIDPDSVSAETDVALTVVDFDSNPAVANVTVNISLGVSLAVSPDAVSLTSLENPDNDSSDDLTFHISGGTPSYTVYSDNEGVIESPGELSSGEDSFTVDPDFVSAGTDVTLTVVDSVGGSAAAAVTLSSTGSPLSISPGSISLTGVSNPDSDDTSDDVTFSISGGTAPYTVYSDNEGVIDAPGELSSGTSSFTVDPDSVGAETDVTLTVVDSEGSTATATVTVTP
jgi:hypothetical protein